MLNIPVSNPRTVQLVTIVAGLLTVLVAHFVPNYSILLSQLLQVVGIGAVGVGGASFTTKPDKGDGERRDLDDTTSIMPEPVKLVAQDRSRLHNDKPDPDDEPAEFRGWDWRPALLVALALAVLTQPACSAFRSVTPADRAQGYAAQAKSAELACKAYTFDLASGLVADVPAMTKLCAGE